MLPEGPDLKLQLLSLRLTGRGAASPPGHWSLLPLPHRPRYLDSLSWWWPALPTHRPWPEAAPPWQLWRLSASSEGFGPWRCRCWCLSAWSYEMHICFHLLTQYSLSERTAEIITLILSCKKPNLPLLVIMNDLLGLRWDLNYTCSRSLLWSQMWSFMPLWFFLASGQSALLFPPLKIDIWIFFNFLLLNMVLGIITSFLLATTTILSREASLATHTRPYIISASSG